jgi:hypothetical protein
LVVRTQRKGTGLNTNTSTQQPTQTGGPLLGALLVHGIGSQKPSTTLLPGSDALTNWLRDRYGADYAVLTHAKLDEGRAVATIRVGPEGKQWDLLVAESHWADSFRSPKLSVVLPWILSSTILVGALGVRDFRNQAKYVGKLPHSDDHPFPTASKWFLTFQAAVLGLLVPLAVIAVALTSVLGVVPRLRPTVRRLHAVLTGTVGDGFVYVDDSTRYAAVVSRVREDLDWLIGECGGNVVVVAHSQGAAVAHDAMTRTPLDGQVDLLTYGSGLRKLGQLRQARGVVEPPSWWRMARFFTFMTVADAALVSATTTIIERYGVRPLLLHLAPALVAIFFILGIYWLGGKRTDGRSGVPKLVWLTLILVGLYLLWQLGMIGRAWLHDREGGDWVAPAELVVCLGFGLFGLRACSRYTGITELSIGATWRTKGAAPNWVDIRATADPVAAVPTMGPEHTGTWPQDIEIHNLRSALYDHTSYWANWAEFVPRVLNFFAARLEKPQRGHLEVPEFWLEREASRRYETTYLLVSFRMLAVAGFSYVLVVSLQNLGLIGEKALDAAGWVIPRLSAKTIDDLQKRDWLTTAVGILTIALAFAAVYSLISRVWGMVVRLSSRPQIRLLREVAPIVENLSTPKGAARVKHNKCKGYLYIQETTVYFVPVNVGQPGAPESRKWDTSKVSKTTFVPFVRSRMTIVHHGDGGTEALIFTTWDLRGTAHLRRQIRRTVWPQTPDPNESTAANDAEEAAAP